MYQYITKEQIEEAIAQGEVDNSLDQLINIISKRTAKLAEIQGRRVQEEALGKQQKTALDIMKIIVGKEKIRDLEYKAIVPLPPQVLKAQARIRVMDGRPYFLHGATGRILKVNDVTVSVLFDQGQRIGRFSWPNHVRVPKNCVEML